MRCALLLLTITVAAGVSWDPELALTTNPATQTTGAAQQPGIAVDPAGNVHIAWKDSRTAWPQVWYRRFDRATQSWSPETTISSGVAWCERPGIACDSAGNLHVVWHSAQASGLNGIWYCRYDAGTGRWRSDTLLVPRPYDRLTRFPSVACPRDRRAVHVAYSGLPDSSPGHQVFHLQWTPGAGWGAIEQLTTSYDTREEIAVAALADGDAAVLWRGRDEGTDWSRIYCRRRWGGVWQAVELASNPSETQDQRSPAVCADTGDAFDVVWHGGGLGGYNRVYYHRRTSAGWGPVELVSGQVQAQQQWPAIARRPGGECRVAWCAPEPGSSVFQVRYAERTTGGWTEPVALTAISSGLLGDAGIACDGDSGVHVSWWDMRSGNKDIYWRQGRAPGAAVSEAHASGRLRAVMMPGRGCVRLWLGDAIGPGARVRLYDATGRAVVTCQPTSAVGEPLDLPVPGAGIYFVLVESGTERLAAKAFSVHRPGRRL